MATRMRLKEMKWLKASDIQPNPNNWRRHPVMQRAALQSILEDVGFADVLLAYENPDGLMLIDGHLRADVLGDELVPVGILDVTPEEADKILATLDPLAGLANVDEEALQSLINQLSFNDQSVTDMLQELLTVSEEPVPDFDELSDSYGEPSPEDFWPVFTIKVSPETKEIFDTLLSKQSGEDAATRFRNLLSQVNG